MVEEDFKVRYHEMGPNHTVPVWALQNYFQQAAAADADKLSYGWEELSSHGVAWVLTNIQFRISGVVTGIQNIKVKTWHCHSDKIHSYRDFIIHNENGEEIVKGTSTWLIIDLEKRKIARTPVSMLNQRLAPLEGIDHTALKPSSFEGQAPLTSKLVRTRREDIDVNNHVNNIHFTAWALEGVPEETQNGMKLTALYVNFKNEAKTDEEILVETYKTENNSFWHILTRQNDGKEIASALTIWS